MALIYGKNEAGIGVDLAQLRLKMPHPQSQNKTISFISKTINFQSVIEMNVASDRMGWDEIRELSGGGTSPNWCKAYFMSRHDER